MSPHYDIYKIILSKMCAIFSSFGSVSVCPTSLELLIQLSWPRVRHRVDIFSIH